MKNNYLILGLCLLFFTSVIGQNDCVNALVVCGNTGFSGLTVSGFGIQEISAINACSSEENNSIWLELPIGTSGTLGFTLAPESTDINEDFDFWVYGPVTNCNTIGNSIRCSTTNPVAAGASDNLTGMNATETDVSEGPGPDGNSFVQWINVLAGETYYIVIDRPIGFSNFDLQWTGSATFLSQPTLPTVNLNLQKCDTDLVPDNATAFDLTQNDAAIIGTQANIVVSYYRNSNDVITGQNQILNPTQFVNTANPQQLFARLTNTISNCFNYTDFTIEVLQPVTTITTNSYTTCDTATDGDGTNGKTDFNLNDVTSSLLSGVNISGPTIKYYLSLLNAQLNQSPLGASFYNTIPFQQSIFISVSDGTNCTSIKEIYLNVDSQPNVRNATLTQCDIGLHPDGKTLFQLENALPTLTNNDPNLSVVFFENGNPVALQSPYSNTTNPQTISAQITNTLTGCSSISTLTLIANVTPSPIVSIPPLCDILNVEDGNRNFDLTTSILNLTATQTAAFFTTLNDALLEVNEITAISNFPIPSPYSATIYVRINENGNCASISELNLIVNPLPNVIRESTGFYVCSNYPDHFITIDAAIQQGSPTDYTYEWHHDGQLLPQTSYEIEVNEAGIFTVSITQFGCSIDREITVLDSNNATITAIQVNDFTTEINSIQILISASSNGNYEYSLDNDNGPYQASNFFDNVDSGIHQLYVKDLNACGVIGPFQINVLGMPKFFTPNDDGYNDTWNMRGADKHFNKNATVYIFDRQGKLLKQISAIGAGWDGTYNGAPVPSDDYWYFISLDDGRLARGHFTLKR